MNKIRILGINTSGRGKESNTYFLLKNAFDNIDDKNIDKQIIVASELLLKPCVHHYSVNEKMCVHPCHITQNDPTDQMKQIYDGILRSDIVIFTTPIYWGNRSQLMQLIVERLNSLENQNSVFKNPIVKNKIAGLMILGHEDGYQQVVGGMMSFLTDLGFIFPPQAYAAWVGESKEITSQDKNIIQHDKDIQLQFDDLVDNCVKFARKILYPTNNGKKFDYEHISKRKI